MCVLSGLSGAIRYIHGVNGGDVESERLLGPHSGFLCGFKPNRKTLVSPNEKNTVSLANISTLEYKETLDRGAIHRECAIPPLGRQLTSGFTGRSKANVIT